MTPQNCFYLMTKSRIILIGVAAVFGLLAALYIFDPNRRVTTSKLENVGRHCIGDNMLSSLNVTTIAQDKRRLVWIGTSAGINIYDGENFTQFSHDIKDTTALPDDYINVLHCDRNGRMWVGTQNGLARYEGGSRFHRIALPHPYANVTAIADAPCPDDSMAMAVSTGRRQYLVKHGVATDITGRKDATRWFGAKTDTLPSAATNPVVLNKPAELITSAFADADGNTWLGYRNAGYQVISDNQTAYIMANDNALARATEGRDVTCLEATGRHILAGTTLRLYVYDSSTDRLNDFFYKNLFGERQILNDIIALDDHRVWLVGNHRLLCAEISGSSINVVGGVMVKGDATHALGCGVLAGQCAYVSSDAGCIVKHAFGAKQAEHIGVASRWYDEETQLAVLADGRILLFMKNMHLALLNPQTGRLTYFDATGAPKEGNIDPAFVRQDSRGIIWLGTKRAGLYCLDLKSHRATLTSMVSDVHIQALAEDSRHQLWITTLKDATAYQPATGAVLKSSLVSSTLNDWDRQFFDNAICLAPDGHMVLGSSDGCKFVPTKLDPNNSGAAKRLCIYRMAIDTEGGKSLIVSDPTVDGRQYTLAQDENNIEFGFFYPNYNRRSALMYQYKLNGYDNDWNAPSYKHEARYANLLPGNYTFRVRVVSSPELPALAERTVQITIRPTFWASAAAWWLYVAALFALIYYVNHMYLRMRTNRIKLLQEHNERERERRTNEMNMSFFANISHEFRNPLTIIAGPLLSLKSAPELPQHMQVTLNRVCMSVNRMLRLIDQMLDFNQLETDALRLKVTEVDATKELRTLADTFEESTRVKQIKLYLMLPDDECRVWMDTDKFEKIMSNLFTNALKHTPPTGFIRILGRIETASKGAKADGGEKKVLRVSVYNSGSHIANDKLGDVFKRYYQLAETENGHHYGWGSGIGLYYVKRLVGLHHGEITARNEGEGVEFAFSLPADKGEYTADERTQEEQHVMQIPIDFDALAADSTDTASHGHTAKVLIVDDDLDVAQYVQSIFASKYDVVIRYSAEDALKDMEQIAPDIILSDVVMGGMSGYEFCRRLKSELMYSHIPVVLVTAKSDMSEQIGGLSLGAVAYVTKPFDPTYLHALVKSLLNNTLLLRHKLGTSTSTKALGNELSGEDRRFMDQLYGYMEQRAAEMELNVTTVCHDLLISQSKFNYKLKQLTGDTPGTFFRKYKLNKAAQMLREGTHTVAEVAMLTGFGTAAHFSVAFKKQFGVSPSEYQQEAKE